MLDWNKIRKVYGIDESIIAEEYKKYRILTWSAICFLFIAYVIGVLLPFHISVLRVISTTLVGLIASFILGVALMIYAILNQDKILIALAFTLLFGFLEGLASYYVFFVAYTIVPHSILFAALITTFLYFLIIYIAAISTKAHEYPSRFIFAILIAALILAIIQLFLPFASLLSILIDLAIIAVFSVALYFDLQRIEREPEKWLSNAIGIFLDMINIILRIIMILIQLFAKKD